MVMTRINGKYSLEAKDENRSELVRGLTQIAQMMLHELDDNDDALFITDLIEDKVN